MVAVLLAVNVAVFLLAGTAAPVLATFALWPIGAFSDPATGMTVGF